MNNNSTKAFTSSVAIIAILFVITAPVLQVASFAGEFMPVEKNCGCSCCDTPDQESNCPVRSQMTENSCACSVTETLPFNSKPLESSTPNQTAEHFDNKSFVISSLFESIKPVSTEIVAFDIASKSHPPYYILNASLLI